MEIASGVGKEELPVVLDRFTTSSDASQPGKTLCISAQALMPTAAIAGRVYGTNDGLSGEFVRAITEDPGGGLWVATSGGLDRVRDRWISKATAGVTEPALREITALCMDLEGVLWVATASRGLR